MFGLVLSAAYTVMLAYVLLRAASVPKLARRLSRRGLVVLGAGLWLAFFLGRFFGHGATGDVATVIEFIDMTLLGTVFLTSMVLLVVDLGTVFGRALPRIAPVLRGWAIVAGVALSIVALVQGHRRPAVVSYDIALPSLPAALDGRVLVALSDTHVSSQIGEQWLARRLEEVQALRPDMVVFLGDIFEGHGTPLRTARHGDPFDYREGVSACWRWARARAAGGRGDASWAAIGDPLRQRRTWNGLVSASPVASAGPAGVARGAAGSGPQPLCCS